MTRTSATGDPESGFTLIELMVVLLIVGLTLGLITLSVRAPAHRPLAEEAAHLAAAMNLAVDEAHLTGQFIVLRMDRQGWRFFEGDDGEAAPIPDDRLPGGRFNPPLERMVAGGEAAGAEGLGRIQLPVGTGEIDPFTGLLLLRGNEQAFLTMDGLGRYQVAP